MPSVLHPPAILATKYGKKPLFNRFGSPATPTDGYQTRFQNAKLIRSIEVTNAFQDAYCRKEGFN